jgi:hypothetical protein
MTRQIESPAIVFVEHDGGREAAGYKGETGDCVVRAIAIAANMPYKQVYKDLYALSGKSPRGGVEKRVYRKYLEGMGWKWVPTMEFGKGCRVHLKSDELPDRCLIVSLSKHLAAVVNGTLYDTHDCSRGGKRCVYGYFIDTKERREN